MPEEKRPSEKSVAEILDLLQKRKGWELVNRSNVSALIIEADSRGDQKLAQELRDRF